MEEKTAPRPGRNWPEYAMEAGETAWLMAAICVGVTFMQSPHFPMVSLIPDFFWRLVCVSFFMAANIVAINFSPWGKRTGAHYNPAVTLTFLRLGKIHPLDALGYVVAQLLGGLAGTGISWLVLGAALSGPPIQYVAPAVQSGGVVGAYVGEFAASFLLMVFILYCTNQPRIARWTGALVGIYVVLANTFESPISGFDINPARWLAAAWPAQDWVAAPAYFLGPVLAMLLAAELVRLVRGEDKIFCAKLHHQNHHRCIFCAYHRTRRPHFVPPPAPAE